jgi:hypothetical protein
MEIDEPRRNHKARRVDLLPAVERAFCDCRNLPAPNTDTAHRIEAGFRVDHPPMNDDEVEVLRRQRDDGQ